MDPAYLRSATRAEHEATEALMPLMNADLTREQYRSVLLRMYPVLAGWERWAGAHADPSLRAMVAERQRAQLMADDIEALHGEVPSAEFDATQVPELVSGTRAAFLGAMYVVEGSTLGGQYIARHVEPLLGLNAEHGTAYFRGYAERTGAMWRAFQGEIAAVPDSEAEPVVAAAKAMFGVFADALRH